MTIGFALLLGFGMVLVIEGITFALLPGRLEDLLRLLAGIPPGTRRAIGLSAVVLGIVLVALALRGGL
ncbi:DUF2065 domain-containing protein [Roseibacterium sp. SDUM158017]|uniref:DUF2065 domain-containing protein n=1 Tax=Roseicyclus salinarum TaxID=3036773 RepID=UPI0024158EEF|nr:DUF2065 domain-containing protein [Roseibacterium sp. SDUM158017]MDG4648567.1 DUF2065 domain-containing protein [Roseibacterium sp. SDUM158017]